MRRMTCRNGFVFWAAVCIGLMTSAARGGSLNATFAPTSADSAMFTLNDIYNKLDTGAAVAKRPGAFTEPSGGPTNGTMQTLNAIMTLVTNRAPLPKTGLTTSYADRDDGAMQIGVTWPTQRFSVVGSPGTPQTNQIRDNLTGLIWMRNASIASNVNLGAWSSVGGTCTWYQAFDVITNYAGPVNGTNNTDAVGGVNGYGGTNDWRLPNTMELHSLHDAGKSIPALSTGWNSVFVNVRTAFNSYYWSSSTYGTTSAGIYDMSDGYTTQTAKDGSGGMTAVTTLWPCRGGR